MLVRTYQTDVVPEKRKTFPLNTGARIPAIGLGTWQSPPNQVRHAVCDALKIGYRHIDTALAYGNEAEVGQGIKDSGVPREEIWVTTKLDNTWHHRVEEGIASSLKDLDCGYVDLYLMVGQETLLKENCDYTADEDCICSTGQARRIRKTRRNISLIGTL